MFIINAYRYFLNLIHTLFDGTNEYVSVSHDASLDFDYDDAFSISGWFYFDSVTTDQFLISKMLNATPFTGYYISITSAGKIRFARSNDNSPDTDERIITNSGLSASTWYHIVCTTNGSTTASDMKIYIDGVSVAKTVEYDNLGTNTTLNSGSFIIGARGDGSFTFDGKIDKVIVYNDELISGEVTTIYNYGRKSGLIGIGNEVSQWELDALNPSDEIGSNNGTSTNMDSSNIVVG